MERRLERLPDVRLDKGYKFCEAARLAGVSPRTLVRWREKGFRCEGGQQIRLRCYRAGRNWFVTGSELLGFLERTQTQMPQIEAPRGAAAGGRDYAAVAASLGL